jgi:hypothetical protein
MSQKPFKSAKTGIEKLLNSESNIIWLNKIEKLSSHLKALLETSHGITYLSQLVTMFLI